MKFELIVGVFFTVLAFSTTCNADDPGPDCPQGTEDITYYPYEGDCTKYWECFAGHSYLYNCPPGLWWHQEIKECDYPGDFCGNSTVPTDTTTEGTTITPPITTTEGGLPDCTGTGSDPVFYPYPGDCTKYYECANGALYSNSCPPDLWWHQELQRCDYPGDYCTDGLKKPKL